jgi:hypothetical protein
MKFSKKQSKEINQQSNRNKIKKVNICEVEKILFKEIQVLYHVF